MTHKLLLERIRKDVFDRTEADLSVVGDGTFEVAVARRMSALKCLSPQEYADIYFRNQNEQQCLLDESTVPETWFFRESDVYPTIIGKLTELSSQGRAPMEILSIPCATGEEAYSIASIIPLAGLSPTHTKIYGVDISDKSIQHAQHGIYGSYSLRAPFYPGTEDLLEKSNKRWVVKEPYRNLCAFERASAFEYLECTQKRFSIILCRNLLIYFDSERQQRLIRLLVERLEPHGLLILSPAEAPLITSCDTLSLKRLNPSCFERISLPPLATTPSPRTERCSLRKKRPSTTAVAAVLNYYDSPKVSTEESTPSPQELFEKQDYDMTFAACTRIIEQGDADQEVCLLAAYSALYLNKQHLAESALRKVIYLNPNHEEALLQLALLADDRGDVEEARRFKARALRSHERNEGRE